MATGEEVQFFFLLKVEDTGVWEKVNPEGMKQGCEIRTTQFIFSFPRRGKHERGTNS